MVKDVNNDLSAILNKNDEYDEYFDPYNTESLNIIDFFATLSNESKELFRNIFSFGSIENFEQKFENNLNYIFGSGILGLESGQNSFLLNEECKKIINIYDELKQRNLNNKFKIWFKAHPRELNNYQIEIQNKIKSILTNNLEKAENIIEKLEFLDHKIPLEYYVMSGLFTPNIKVNKSVEIEIGYSTFVLSVIDSSKAHNIINKILIDKENDDIQLRFGVPTGKNIGNKDNKSKCFPKNKVVYY